MKNKIIHIVKQKLNLLCTIKRNNANGSITACVGSALSHYKRRKKTEGTGGRGRRRKELLDNLKEKRS